MEANLVLKVYKKNQTKATTKRYYPNSISTKYMNGIISAIPNNWKHIIMCETMIHDIICNLTNYIFRETSVDDWHGIYSMSYV